MSDPYPAAPPVKARPSTVTISSYLLYLVAALQVVGLIAVLSVMGTMQQVYRDAYEGTAAEGMEAIITVSLLGGAILSLLIAAGLVVLGLLNNRGKNPARIVTWVLGGIFLCCVGGGLAVNAAGNAFTGGVPTDPNMPDPAQVQRNLDAALPGWYDPVSTLLSVVGLLALLAALILLALPPSNEFFRKPAAAWEPPVPGGGYGTPPMPGGAYPGTPSVPGYPSVPGAPPVPGYPPAPGTPPAPGYPPVPGASPPAGNPPAGDNAPDNPSGNPPGSQPPSGS